MSQADIIKLLKKKRRWMEQREISKILDLTSSTSCALKKLCDRHEILKRVSKKWNGFGGKPFEYKIK